MRPQHDGTAAIAQVALGLFELAFVVSMFLAKPDPTELLAGLTTVHNDPGYLKLVAANIGAVVRIPPTRPMHPHACARNQQQWHSKVCFWGGECCSCD